MNKLSSAIVGLSLAAGLAGCSTLERPNWFHPGPAQYQQAQAEQFDPYPENDTGPAIVGARPLSYDKPGPEVSRVQPPLNPLQSRWMPWNWSW
jgi:hypothetical protein